MPYTNTGIKKDTREIKRKRWLVGGWREIKTLAGIFLDTREQRIEYKD